jgi:hypothetical protein
VRKCQIGQTPRGAEVAVRCSGPPTFSAQEREDPRTHPARLSAAPEVVVTPVDQLRRQCPGMQYQRGYALARQPASSGRIHSSVVTPWSRTQHHWMTPGTWARRVSQAKQVAGSAPGREAALVQALAAKGGGDARTAPESSNGCGSRSRWQRGAVDVGSTDYRSSVAFSNSSSQAWKSGS